MSALTYEQDPSYYLDNSPSSKKKKGRHRKLDTLTYETIREYFVYTQSQAAKKLGVSVSTLKRKFYSLGYENRWPYIRTVTPKKKGANNNNKRTHDEESDETSEVSDEEEEEYESEEEVIREPITRSARKVTPVAAAVPQIKKRKVVVEEETNKPSVATQSSRIGFASTSSAFMTHQEQQPKPITIEQNITEEEEDEEEEEYIASEVEEEQQQPEEEDEEEEEQPIIIGGGNSQKEGDNHYLNNNSNISFSDMSHYSSYVNPLNNSMNNNNNNSNAQRLFNEQSQTSNQSQDFGEEIVAASMLFQFASEKKKFSQRILPPISSLHSTNFMNYHAQPLKKRIPSLGDYRNFNRSTSYQPNDSSLPSSVCNTVVSEGLILPPIKNLIRDDEHINSIGFNHHIIQQQQQIS